MLKNWFKVSVLGLLLLSGCAVGEREVFSETSHSADTADEYTIQVLQEEDNTLEVKTIFNDKSQSQTYPCDTKIDRADVQTTWNPEGSDPKYTSVQVVVKKDDSIFVDETIEFGNW